jgi:hypothetical protein
MTTSPRGLLASKAILTAWCPGPRAPHGIIVGFKPLRRGKLSAPGGCEYTYRMNSAIEFSFKVPGPVWRAIRQTEFDATRGVDR